jgi:NADH-quinone oxidoreductase subunit M
MYLSSLLLLPLIGSAVIAGLPAGRTLLAKQIALGTSVLTAILGIAMALQFDRALGTFQFVESHEWITSFGVKYGLGIDGTGLVLILMALILAPIVILASWNEGEGGRFSQKAFFALLLVWKHSWSAFSLPQMSSSSTYFSKRCLFRSTSSLDPLEDQTAPTLL